MQYNNHQIVLEYCEALLGIQIDNADISVQSFEGSKVLFMQQLMVMSNKNLWKETIVGLVLLRLYLLRVFHHQIYKPV